MGFTRWSGVSLAVASLLLGGCSGDSGGNSTNDEPGAPRYLANMAQDVTPLSPEGSRFETLNPDLPDKPDWLAGQAVTTAVSPDGQTLLVLTSGYNRVYSATPSAPYPWYTPDSFEYVFVYDLLTRTPVKKQVVKVANTYNGIAFDPSGKAFYVAGGVDDNLHVFTRIADGTWGEPVAPMALRHVGPDGKTLVGNGLDVIQPAAGQTQVSVNTQVAVKPCAAGVAVSSDGQTLVVANYYNDSISVLRGGLNHWSAPVNFDLRPGKSGGTSGQPGGEYPFWVAVKGTEAEGTATAYVSSIRDREIVVVNLTGTPAVTTRIPVKGKPNKLTLNKSQSRLYVVEDQTDTVDVIDTATNTLLQTIQVIAPPTAMPDHLEKYRGANSNSVTLSPDEKQLYVTNGNLNCIAVVDLEADGDGEVVGLIPTGWYPNSVSFSADGNWVYAVNGKSATGANPDFRYSNGPAGHTSGMVTNQYIPQLVKAGLQSFPRPSPARFAALTAQVASNNRFSYTDSASDLAVVSAVREKIKHVIFLIKENRTYDQVLGDLEIGNGDPSLAEFGERYTPNQHNLARRFVTLDNVYATAEVSNDGWCWTTAGRAPDVVQRQVSVTYAGRGLSLDTEGTNRSVNVALSSDRFRYATDHLSPLDPDLLPGQANVAAPDGPPPEYEVDKGYVWDAALRKGLTVRNYGFFIDTTRYAFAPGSENSVPLDPTPFANHQLMAVPSSPSLFPHTDLYFRGFDNAYPDYYRFKEWEREFDGYEADGTLPALSLVRFMHDHTGSYATALDGVNTPEVQQADNDYAVGLLVEKLSKSPKYKDNTLIFIIEDDAQDGADHVDAHRTIAFVAGAYVKQRTLITSQYNTVNFLRTIEEVLGLSPMNLNDALARPMADVFDTAALARGTPAPWAFAAVSAPILDGTTLPPFAAKAAGKRARRNSPKPTHDAQYWAQVTQGMDFSAEDRFDFATYNRILWKGLMGSRPYPEVSSGQDLRHNRKALLARHRRALEREAAR